MTPDEFIKSLTAFDWVLISISVFIICVIALVLLNKVFDWLKPKNPDPVYFAIDKANEEVAHRPHVRAGAKDWKRDY